MPHRSEKLENVVCMKMYTPESYSYACILLRDLNKIESIQLKGVNIFSFIDYNLWNRFWLYSHVSLAINWNCHF